MRAVRCLIVDDDPTFRLVLAGLLTRFDHINVVGEATSLHEARQLLKATDPDLVFLDMELGMELGLSLIEHPDAAPMVIVVSASEAYAIKAFELRALDYLVKPFGLERLREALSRLRLCCVGGSRAPRCRAMSALLRADDVALIDDGPNHFVIHVQSILFIRADGNYTEVRTDDTVHLVRRTCEEWKRSLPPELFAQLDRSLIVNLGRVAGWRAEGREARLLLGTGKHELALGRAAAERFKARLGHGIPT